MIPVRYANVLFSLLLSGMMSFLVSGTATFRTVGIVEGFLGLWIGAWLSGWLVAFPAVLVVAPVTRRLVAVLTRNE